ncbi:MAG TPA: hypothetical protein V6C97_33575 [Oculatellaceae cyanobacterium]
MGYALTVFFFLIGSFAKSGFLYALGGTILVVAVFAIVAGLSGGNVGKAALIGLIISVVISIVALLLVTFNGMSELN